MDGQFLTCSVPIPNLLVIKINRVDEKGQKINLPAHVQEDIKFNKKSYQLKSFICHYGEEAETGHYKAYTYSHHSRTVTKFDDNNGGMPYFETADAQEVHQELRNSYIMFYEEVTESVLLETDRTEVNRRRRSKVVKVRKSHITYNWPKYRYYSFSALAIGTASLTDLLVGCCMPPQLPDHNSQCQWKGKFPQRVTLLNPKS